MKFVRFFSRLSAALALLLASAIHPGRAQNLETQTFRDWSVLCRDSGYCIASTSGRSRNGEVVTFKLERNPKPGSKIFVTIQPSEHMLAVGMKVDVNIVGHDYHFFGPVRKIYDGNEMAFAEKTANKSIQKLREGRFGEITVEFGGSVGKVKYDVSLQGVSSALAIMDVMQRRLDREDAAVITGGESMTLPSWYDFSSGKLAPLAKDEKEEERPRDPEEDIDYGEEEVDEDALLGQASVVYEVNQLPDGVQMPGYRMLNCAFPDVVTAFGAKVINLDPGVFLYLVPCRAADANVPHYAALEVAGETETLEFQEPASDTGQRVSLIINPEWRPDAGQLSSHQYFAATLDCGRYESHNISYEEKAAYLSEYRLKKNCDGKVTAPSSYSLVWNGEGD